MKPPSSFIRRILFLGILIGFFFLVFTWFSSTQMQIFSYFAPPPYYAVFITNGQVYFGHITKLDSSAINLSDVYYLRTQTNLSNDALNKKKEETNVNISIVKLGKEIHGPVGQMIINRQQVLFWEPLRKDGEVVKAIEKYQQD